MSKARNPISSNRLQFKSPLHQMSNKQKVMSSKCFLPNCANVTGIPFPKNPDLRNAWLESLKIENLVPTSSSFICLEHFQESDIITSNAGTRLSNKIKKGAIPTILEPQNKTSSEEIESNLKPDVGLEEADQNSESTKDTLESSQLQLSTGSPVTEDFIKCEIGSSSSDSKSKAKCRLCDSSEGLTFVTELLDEDTTIMDAVDLYLSPVKVSLTDEFSKEVCSKCIETLKTFHEFRINCLSKFTEQIEHSKRKQNQQQLIESRVSVSSCSDTSEDSLTEFLQIKKKPRVEGVIKDGVEEELRRILDVEIPRVRGAENLIISVGNDEKGTKIESLSQINLPIVIKPVKSPVKTVNAKSENKVDKNEKCVQIPTEEGQVLLPKGIRVSVQEKFESQTGIFEVTPVDYILDSQFCSIDNYLFEFRLSKGNQRQLRCLASSCGSYALQARESGEYSNTASVLKPHNHKPPNAAEMKKQMFYNIMRKKLQSDKSLNFKNVYEDMVELDNDIRQLVPLRNVINEICKYQLQFKLPKIETFDQFFDLIESDLMQKIHFTHTGKQFYQEKLSSGSGKALVFANVEVLDQLSDSKLMYVDASFKIDTKEGFDYQLVTVLVWIEDSYYPILFSLVNEKSHDIYKKIFEYLHDELASSLRPTEIVTDYEVNIYYAVGEVYSDSNIGGSVFYYTQNLYKKICALKLSRYLETNSYFRNVYHMLLMLPLLPVNTISDGLNNIETQAKDLGLAELMKPVFKHVRKVWMSSVTPELFCVHRLENRINENVIAPFKKLRDFIMLSKGKAQKNSQTIIGIVEKIIELEAFLQNTYSAANKKSFARDLSCSQKRNVLKAWQYIESHPKININNFFSKVLGYIKCMENQLWIWGFYRYTGEDDDELIEFANFSFVPGFVEEEELQEVDETVSFVSEENSVVMEAVIDENGTFVLQNAEENDSNPEFEGSFLKFVCK